MFVSEVARYIEFVDLRYARVAALVHEAVGCESVELGGIGWAK